MSHTPPPLSDYERRALKELYAWKHPPDSWRGRAGDRLETLIDAVATRLPTRLIDELLERGIPVLNRAANATASRELVLAGYRRRGYSHVRSFEDVASMSLEDVERVVGTKRVGELVKGAGEGGLAGFYGAPGAAVDVPALLGLALRSVNLFAYSYGFDPSTDDERAFVLSVVAASAAFGTKAKQLTRAGIATGGRIASKEFVKKRLKKLPPQLLARLAAAETAKIVPVVSAVTGGAFNAWFLRSVAVHARYAYRQRFLERLHGPKLLKAYGL